MPATLADRCERYRRRLDEHLATLPSDDDRRRFCDRESAKWIERYETFQRAVAAGTYEGTATAWDFHITMGDIELRRVKYGPAMRERA